MKKILGLMLMLFISCFAFSSTNGGEHIKKVTAITEVFGNGQKLTAVAIEYDKAIKNSSLTNSSFTVEGRTVTKIYANDTLEKTSNGKNGKYVIIELSKDDKNSLLFVPVGRSFEKKEAKATVIQLSDIKTTFFKTYKADSKAVVTSAVKNLVMDDFLSFEYKDSKTGKTLKYNLFIPKNYDSKKSYPLVYFGHDAGVMSTDVKTTLYQGIGAIVWATPEAQAKNECFVLAPQYPEQYISDAATTDYLEMTVDLINSVANKYSINKNKIYATGQSGGGMLSIAMAINHPDLFAAMFLVACQWDSQKMADKLSDKNMWIVVSQGDIKAFPGMNASTEAMAKVGARIAKNEWSGRSTSEEIKKLADDMLTAKANINYVSLIKGTVVGEGLDDNPPNNHMGTWPIAYTFEPIRDWLFTQSK